MGKFYRPKCSYGFSPHFAQIRSPKKTLEKYRDFPEIPDFHIYIYKKKLPIDCQKRPVMLFEGVCVTTVILAPGACGLGLRAALLATTSPESVAAVAPVAVFQKSPISCYLSYLRARGLSKIDPNPSLAPGWPRVGSGGAWENLYITGIQND